MPFFEKYLSVLLTVLSVFCNQNIANEFADNASVFAGKQKEMLKFSRENRHCRLSVCVIRK